MEYGQCKSKLVAGRVMHSDVICFKMTLQSSLHQGCLVDSHFKVILCF